MALAADSCTSFDELFSDVSADSFSLSGNLVLLSNEKIAGWLADSFASVPGKSRYDATRYAIAAFSRHFKDQFDAVAVFPSSKVDSGSTWSEHWTWSPDYTGAPTNLRSAIIHNHWTGHSAFAFKHEILHRFGVFNKLVPKKLGTSGSSFSHWGLTATGTARGQLGGWPRSAVTCTDGSTPKKDATPPCADKKLRFAVGNKEGHEGASNDGNPMSEFELLMMGLINPDQLSGDLMVCDTTDSTMKYGGEKVGDHIVGDCASGIKYITPADLEANWQLKDKDDVRLKPRGKSSPHMRVAALVVYASDAERAEAMSAGPKYESKVRDAKQWLDEYLDTVRDSWAKDTTVQGKQLSSLTFPVHDCHRVGKPDCTASDLTTEAPKTTAPPPAGKECTPGKTCCGEDGMWATTAVQCLIAGKRKGYCNAGVCSEPSRCNAPLTSTITLNGYCGVSPINPCRAKCKDSATADCYDSGRWVMGVPLADGAYCVKGGVRGRCKDDSCQPITTTPAPDTTAAPVTTPAAPVTTPAAPGTTAAPATTAKSVTVTTAVPVTADQAAPATTAAPTTTAKADAVTTTTAAPDATAAATTAPAEPAVSTSETLKATLSTVKATLADAGVATSSIAQSVLLCVAVVGTLMF